MIKAKIENGEVVVSMPLQKARDLVRRFYLDTGLCIEFVSEITDAPISAGVTADMPHQLSEGAVAAPDYCEVPHEKQAQMAELIGQIVSGDPFKEALEKSVENGMWETGDNK